MNVKQLVEAEEKLNELIRKILQPRKHQDTMTLANMPEIFTQKTGRDIRRMITILSGRFQKHL